MASKKNILLIIADDLGRDLNIYGSKNSPNTPNIDRLAAEGTVFDNAFASTASCSGSRSTLFTGLHTHQNGQYGLAQGYKFLHYFSTFEHIDTLPKIFNRLGYLTGIGAKVHVGPESAYPFIVRDERGARDCQWIASRLSAFIERAQDEDKAFIYTVGFVDPHRDMTRGGFGNDADYPGIQKHEYDTKDVNVPDFLSDIPEVRQEVAEYYQAIDRMDQGIGMLLDVLEKSGETDSTLVIFLSDNGPPFVNSKTTLYDAGIRLPMLIRCPGQTPGSRNPNLISYTDILPTLLDWTHHADLPDPNPAGCKRLGRSLLPALTTSKISPHFNAVYGSHTFHETSSYYPTRYLRTHEWKYHRNIAWQLPFPLAGDLYSALSFEGMRNQQPPPVKIGGRLLTDYIHRPPEMLFDIQNDACELRDLSQVEGFRGVLAELRRRLEDWQRSTADQWLLRDGVSLAVVYNHLEAGLRVPDRFDFDVRAPGNRESPIVRREDGIPSLRD